MPIERWQLASGAQVYFAAVPALPIVDVSVEFDAGGRHDPSGQAGLADAMVAMMDKGVSAHGGPPAEPALDENQLGEAWADLGARFNISAGSDRLKASLRSLAEPGLLARAVALAARQIGQPAFSEAVWPSERERLLASLRESLTRPGVVAERAFARAVYGGHPYGDEASDSSLAAIDTDALRRQHARTLVACRAKLTLVGAISRAQAERIASELLSRLPEGCPALAPVPEVRPLAQPVQQNIAFSAAQAQVLIGQPGYPRQDPDHFALTLGNYILGGGGFASRLMHELREKRGLTYGVWSSFSPGKHAGAFRVSVQTRPEQADEAVQVAREVLARFVAQGPSEAELRDAKANVIGGFPLLLDSNLKLAGNIANIAWNDLPLDYLDTWSARMNAVTVADVRAAFARKLQPERMVTVVLGKR